MGSQMRKCLRNFWLISLLLSTLRKTKTYWNHSLNRKSWKSSGKWSQIKLWGRMAFHFTLIDPASILSKLTWSAWCLPFRKKLKLEGALTPLFLALIPKEVNPSSFDRFRLISLYNASYKILAKLRANCVKPLLGKLISSFQGGFVKGRHLVDNVL